MINLTDDRCYLSFQRPASDKSDTDDRCYLSFQRPASDKSDTDRCYLSFQRPASDKSDTDHSPDRDRFLSKKKSPITPYVCFSHLLNIGAPFS